MTKKWQKVLESVIVAGCSAVILIVLIYVVPDCQPIHGYEARNTTEKIGTVQSTSAMLESQLPKIQRNS